MTTKRPTPEQDPHLEGTEQAEPFVPPDSPDPVPEVNKHPAKPEAIDKDFTAEPDSHIDRNERAKKR